MKESSSISRFLMTFGLLIIFKNASYLPINSLTLAAIAVAAVVLYDFGQRFEALRSALLALSLSGLMLPLAVFSRAGLPLLPQTAVYHALRSLELGWFKGQFALGFFNELYAYITIAEKTDFLHWHYLFFILMISLVSLLRLIYKRGRQSLWFLVLLAGTSLLWFAKVDMGLAFGLLFSAYASERLTENGKGFLFGTALPLVVVAGALLMTVATPITAINDYLAEFTSEEGWLRSELMSGGGTRGFDLATVGFYPLEGRLGGPVKPTKELMFRITATEKLYLRGRVKAIYQDNQWFPEAEPKGEVNLGVALPLRPADEKLLGYRLYDSQLRQSGLLNLLGTLTVDIPMDRLAPMQGETLRFKGAINSDLIKDYRIEGYGVSAAPAKAVYLSLPEGYGGKVAALTKEIIKGAKTDAEKVKRIQNYLLNHYNYALAVEVPPADQDFVTYFLTEGKQGYCVYFASAATIMSRLAQVPARYVEGFVTYDSYQRGRDQAITGERAHAWTEVYYEGQWHTLETTPTFARADGESEEALLLPEVDETPVDVASEKEEDDMDEPLAAQKSVQDTGLMGLWWLLAPIGLLSVLLLAMGLKLRAYFNPSVALGSEAGDSMGANNRLTGRYARLLLLGLIGHFRVKDAAFKSPGEILRELDDHAPDLGLKGLVEIVNQSLYDSNESNAQGLAAIRESYWRLFERYYSFGEKASWLMRIAWKGRLRHGFYDKDTTP